MFQHIIYEKILIAVVQNIKVAEMNQRSNIAVKTTINTLVAWIIKLI